MTIFGQHAPQYWSAGLPVMPLRSRTKAPLLRKWQELCSRMPTEAEQEQWIKSYPDNNIGLPLGLQSGLCMIDIDTDDETVIATIKALLPPSPWERRGKKGMAIAYRWSGQANFKIRGANGSMIVEMLGEGNQIVLPPSIHPDTNLPYVATSNLWEVMDQIPDLPADFEAKLRTDLAVAGLTLATTSAPGAQRSGTSGVDVIIPETHGVARYLALALSAACSKIVDTEEGSRNSTLFGQSKDLARHVAAADVDWAPFAAKLEEAGLIAGLEPGEVPSSVASGWAAGCQEPTPWIRIAREYIFLGAQNRFYHPESGSLLVTDAFNSTYGYPHPGKLSFAKFLTVNGFITKVQDITYTPKEETGVQVIDGLPYYNVYRPSEVVATPGDATPYKEFMEFLIPKEEERDHLLKVMAHSIRYPGERIHHAVGIRTQHQGVGKSMNFDIWGRLVGTSNVRFTSSREMQSNFDGWKVQNTLLICPELGLGNGLSAYNDVKAYITDDQAVINEKHLAPRRWTIFSTFLFSTNLEVPMLIEPDDRRIFMIDSPARPRPPEYYAEFAAWWQNNLGVVRHFFDKIDLSDFNPHAPPPMTEAKQRLIKRSANPLVQDLAHLIETRKGQLDRDVVTLEEIAFELGGARVSDRTLAKSLKELGAISLGQQRVSVGRVSLWVIRNQDIWMKWGRAAQVREFERTVGLFSDPSIRSLEDQDVEVAYLADLPGVDLEAMFAASDRSMWMFL